MLLPGDKIRVDMSSLQSWMKRKLPSYSTSGLLAPNLTLCPQFQKSNPQWDLIYKILPGSLWRVYRPSMFVPFCLHLPTYSSKSGSGLESNKDALWGGPHSQVPYPNPNPAPLCLYSSHIGLSATSQPNYTLWFTTSVPFPAVRLIVTTLTIVSLLRKHIHPFRLSSNARVCLKSFWYPHLYSLPLSRK